MYTTLVNGFQDVLLWDTLMMSCYWPPQLHVYLQLILKYLNILNIPRTDYIKL